MRRRIMQRPMRRPRMPKYKVVEKFISINGEGLLAGELAVFIRLQGCNLQCSYCDTVWANSEEAPYQLMTEEEIYTYITSTGIQNVTLTGGEPLLTKEIGAFLKLISQDDHLKLEIETNGSIDLLAFTQLKRRPVFTMDYKLPSSGMESHMLLSNLNHLENSDSVKFVLGNIEDLERARGLIERYNLISKCQVFFSTVFGKLSSDEVVTYMKKHKMNGVKLQLQMHKIIWDPSLRGV